MVWRVGEVINGRGSPITLTTKHHSNIFTVAFSCDNRYIFSGGEFVNSPKNRESALIEISLLVQGTTAMRSSTTLRREARLVACSPPPHGCVGGLSDSTLCLTASSLFPPPLSPSSHLLIPSPSPFPPPPLYPSPSLLPSGRMVSHYEHLEAVYDISPHPSSPDLILTASEDGSVNIIDTRRPKSE